MITEAQIRAEARKRWIAGNKISETDFIAGANFALSQDSTIEKAKELEHEIKRLQEKYDENNYGNTALMMLKGIEQTVDCAFKIYAEELGKSNQRLNKLKELRDDWEMRRNHLIDLLPRSNGRSQLEDLTKIVSELNAIIEAK